MVRSSLPVTSPLITMLFPMLTDSCCIGRSSPRVSPIPPETINGWEATLGGLDGARGVSSRFHIGVTSITPTVPFGPAERPRLAPTDGRSGQYRGLYDRRSRPVAEGILRHYTCHAGRRAPRP